MLLKLLALVLCISARIVDAQDDVVITSDASSVLVSTPNQSGTLIIDGLDVVATLKSLVVRCICRRLLAFV